jgi:hypothetical protein
VVVAILLVLKAALGFWGAWALLTASRRQHRSFLGEAIHVRHASLGVALAVLAVASLVMAVALARLLPWSRVATFGLEAVGGVLALSRIGSRPASSATSLAFSVVIVGLLLLPTSAQAFRSARTTR